MTARRATVCLILACSFAVLALVRLPAALLASWFLPESIRLESAEGTLWQGQAGALGVNGIVVQQGLTWDVRWNDLLRGALIWNIRGKLATEFSSAHIRLMPSGIILENVQAKLPLQPLLAQNAKLKLLGLGGMLNVTSTAFSFKPDSTLSIRLENLFSTLAPALGTLGTSDIQITTQQNHMAAWNVRPVEGRLAISGEGQLDLQRNAVTGKLALKPEESLATALRPLLSFLQHGPDGTYVLDMGSS